MESQHVCWDTNLGCVCESVLGVESSCFEREGDFFSFGIEVEGRGQGSEGTMIVMPSAPVILSFALVFEGKVVEDPSNVRLSPGDDIVKVFLRVSFASGSSIAIDLESQHCTDIHHHA